MSRYDIRIISNRSMNKLKLGMMGVLLVALTGCVDVGQGTGTGGTDNGANSPLAPYLPQSAPSGKPNGTSNGSSGGSGSTSAGTPSVVSGTDTMAPSGNPVPPDSYPATNANGYYSITQVRHLNLTDSSTTVLGFSVDQAGFFMLERVQLFGGIIRWKVLSTPSVPGTGGATWRLECDILGDNSTLLGFSTDSTYYYLSGGTARDISGNQYLRRFRRSDCSEVSALDVGHALSTWWSFHSIYTVVSGFFFFELDSGTRMDLYAWDMTKGTLISQPLSAALGGETLNNVRSVWVTPQWIWVLTTYEIWKFDLSAHPIAWAALPRYTPYDLTYSTAVVAIDENTLVVVDVSNGQIYRYFLDVSQF